MAGGSQDQTLMFICPSEEGHSLETTPRGGSAMQHLFEVLIYLGIFGYAGHKIRNAWDQLR